MNKWMRGELVKFQRFQQRVILKTSVYLSSQPNSFETEIATGIAYLPAIVGCWDPRRTSPRPRARPVRIFVIPGLPRTHVGPGILYSTLKFTFYITCDSSTRHCGHSSFEIHLPRRFHSETTIYYEWPSEVLRYWLTICKILSGLPFLCGMT